MESGGAHTLCILRRMNRESLGTWAWNAYTPLKGLPQELRFDLLDENERPIGQFVYGKIRFLKGVELLTPWGPAKIDWKKSDVRFYLGERELVRIESSLLKKGFRLVFPSGATMDFKRRKGYKNDIEFADGAGSISIFEETGTLPVGSPEVKVQMTREEIKMLPRHERPRSTESREYVQYRVLAWGRFPVDVNDLKAALTIFVSFGRIVDEIPNYG